MSERDRFSLIGHAAMPLMNPLTEQELASILDAAALSSSSRVLDLGAGRSDLARLCAVRYGASTTSVDRSPAACDAARGRTTGLPIEVACQDAQAYLAIVAPRGLDLTVALGSLHAFGSGVLSWTAARDALAPTARSVLLGDLVALGSHAAREMDVATLHEITPLLGAASRHVILGPERVIAYERAWCDAVERYLREHPADPRSEWARERIAWSRTDTCSAAWAELAFVAMLTSG